MIDTGDLIVHELKSRVVEAFSEAGRNQLMQTTVMSFGYKHGIPIEADLVIDCRFWLTHIGCQSYGRGQVWTKK